MSQQPRVNSFDNSQNLCLAKLLLEKTGFQGPVDKPVFYTYLESASSNLERREEVKKASGIAYPFDQMPDEETLGLNIQAIMDHGNKNHIPVLRGGIIFPDEDYDFGSCHFENNIIFNKDGPFDAEKHKAGEYNLTSKQFASYLIERVNDVPKECQTFKEYLDTPTPRSIKAQAPKA